jgi:hypothetical protein
LELIQYCKNKILCGVKELRIRIACQTKREKLSKQINTGISILKKKKSIISQLSDDEKKKELDSTLVNLLAQSAELRKRIQIKNDTLHIECIELRKLNADIVEFERAFYEFIAAFKKIST